MLAAAIYMKKYEISCHTIIYIQHYINITLSIALVKYTIYLQTTRW